MKLNENSRILQIIYTRAECFHQLNHDYDGDCIFSDHLNTNEQTSTHTIPLLQLKPTAQVQAQAHLRRHFACFFASKKWQADPLKTSSDLRLSNVANDTDEKAFNNTKFK